jgi:enoyl-CoA hydratase
MAAEYRMAVRRVAAADFLEGVRALLVDKDRAPRWRPAGVGGVDPGEAAALGEPLPAGGGGVEGLDLSEVDRAVATLAAAS